MTYRRQGVFGAIADPHRRAILDLLLEGERTAGEIGDRFDLSRPAIFKHLRVLEESDLIVVRKRGRHRVHRLNPAPLRSVREWLGIYERFWDDRLQRLQGLIETDDIEEEPDR